MSDDEDLQHAQHDPAEAAEVLTLLEGRRPEVPG
jgi:hypothetical protein